MELNTHRGRGLGEASIDLRSDVETVLVRRFNAAASAVFTAWTTPDHVRQWWPMPGSTVTLCEIDLRPGGGWRWALRTRGGVDIVWSGRYQVVDPPRRLVYSERYEGAANPPHIVELTFAEADGITTLTTTLRYESRQDRDEHLRPAVRTGLPLAYGRIDRILRNGEM